jgi:hypothetical protein
LSLQCVLVVSTAAPNHLRPVILRHYYLFDASPNRTTTCEVRRTPSSLCSRNKNSRVDSITAVVFRTEVLVQVVVCCEEKAYHHHHHQHHSSMTGISIITTIIHHHSLSFTYSPHHAENTTYYYEKQLTVVVTTSSSGSIWTRTVL